MLLLGLLPSANAQTFITIKPPPQPNTGAVTPAFVASPPNGGVGVVPAHAIQKAGNKNFQVIPVQGATPVPTKDEDREMLIRTDLPGAQRLFIRESEDQFWDRFKNELAKEGRPMYLPEKAVVSREPYRPRFFEPIAKHVEPSYVLHGRLLFEQPNTERAGWDFGMLTPAVNLGVFWYDAAMLPYHLCSNPGDRMETSAGKCLPGDQSPLLLYRERFSVAGIVGQAGAGAGLLFLFP